MNARRPFPLTRGSFWGRKILAALEGYFAKKTAPNWQVQREAVRLQEIERYEFKQLERELYRWGRFVVRYFEDQGYSGMNIIEAFRRGAGGGEFGHRVLCMDWPTDIYATHGRFLRLTDLEQDVILLKYAICVKSDGNLWTEEEHCAVYGITHAGYRKRLERARRKIQGLPVD